MAFKGQKLGVACGVVISSSSALCSIAPAASLAVPFEAGNCRPELRRFGLRNLLYLVAAA